MPQCKQHVLPPKSTRRCAIQRGNIDCNSRAAPPSRRRRDSLSPLSPYRSNSVASWAAGLRSSARWLAVICCARPRRWAASSSCPRPRSPSSDLAAANGVVPTSDVGWWAARKVWGSSALFPSSAFSQAGRKLRASKPCPFFAHGGVAFDGDCGAARQTGFAGLPRAPGAVRQTSMHRPPDPRRARKPTSGAVVPLNRVRTGGGRGASVPRPPGAGVPGWFGPGRRLGPPVALRHMGVRLVSARRGLT